MTATRALTAPELGWIILDTIADADELGAPSGHIYAALMTEPSLDLHKYNTLIGALQQAGLLTLDRSHVLRLTPVGKEKVEAVRKSLHEARLKRQAEGK